jgi:hypothetical protein
LTLYSRRIPYKVEPLRLRATPAAEADASLSRAFIDAIMAARSDAKLPEQSQKKIAGSWRDAGQRKAA